MTAPRDRGPSASHLTSFPGVSRARDPDPETALPTLKLLYLRRGSRLDGVCETVSLWIEAGRDIPCKPCKLERSGAIEGKVPDDQLCDSDDFRSVG